MGWIAEQVQVDPWKSVPKSEYNPEILNFPFPIPEQSVVETSMQMENNGQEKSANLEEI